MTGQIGHFRFPERDHDDGLSDANEPAPPARPEVATSLQVTKGPRWFESQKRIGAGNGVCALLLIGLSFLPFYGRTITTIAPGADCRNVANAALHRRCVDKAVGQGSIAQLHWNAWGSVFSWVPVLLLVAAGVAIGFKAIFFTSDKVVLTKSIRLALLFGDVLFLVAIVHIPHGPAGRSWALWLSLLCVIALNIGALLATTSAGEWVARRWPRRQGPGAPSPAAPPVGAPVAVPPQTQRQTNPYPANQGFQVDYRPGPHQVPQQREPEQTGWPQQPSPPRQAGWPQSPGFPTQGEQR